MYGAKAEFYHNIYKRCLFLVQTVKAKGGNVIFSTSMHRTTLKQMCASVVGVKLWNSLQNDLKGCINVFHLKKMYKERIIRQYKGNLFPYLMEINCVCL